MRLGPGEHLKGYKLLDGAVEPEEVSLDRHRPKTLFVFSPLLQRLVRLFPRAHHHPRARPNRRTWVW